ncbi:MAG: DUF4271 domain-containing protein [Prevotella sp.]|nr:DUF4271 domain-containing protein [Prevotella sp.]
MARQDSIVQEALPQAEMAAGVKASQPRHPYQVLRSLPKDATPAQQDSAIQAVFKPREIRYSQRPDTLRLPGHEPGKSLREVSLPKYYREGFFSKDTLLHPEIDGGRRGVAGDPVPYRVRDDNMITSLLLLCLIMVIVALSNSRRFIVRQVKDFLYVPRAEASAITETSSEVRFQLFLVLQTCLLFSVFQYFYTQHYIGDTFVLPSQYHLIAVYFAMFTGYFVVKGLLYTIVDITFFGMRRHMQWMKSLLFISSSEAVLLLPVVLLQVYFDLSIHNVVIYFIVVLIFVKILTFYKCYFIFFRRMGAFLQIILYFCALEAVPIAAFWGALVMTGNYLKINF